MWELQWVQHWEQMTVNDSGMLMVPLWAGARGQMKVVQSARHWVQEWASWSGRLWESGKEGLLESKTGGERDAW